MVISELVSSFTMYYGLDWMSFILGIIGYLLITEKKSYGFLFNALAVTCAAIVAVIASQYGFLVANSAQFIVAIRAYIKWKKDEKITLN